MVSFCRSLGQAGSQQAGPGQAWPGRRARLRCMDQTRARDVIARTWADDVIPSLSGLIAIPALPPSFDAGWAATGQLHAAVSHVANWAGSRGLGRPEVVELDGRAPLLLIDI